MEASVGASVGASAVMGLSVGCDRHRPASHGVISTTVVVISVKVSIVGGETYLRVEQNAGIATWPRLAIYSANIIVPNIDASSHAWLPGVAWSVADRVSGGGDEKGRAIAIWHRAKNQEPTPFAVLTWHTAGSGPFYLFDVGSRMDLGAPLRRELEAALLDVMLRASKHPDAPVADDWQDTLRWATVQFLRAPHRVRRTYAEEGIKRAKKLAFEKYQPPPAAPASMSKTWLGERSFER